MSAVPTLTDAKGLGGVVAQGGFDYQDWNAVVRLPGWLAMPSFDGFLMEGTEDFEARFLSPAAGTGRILDRFQVKSETLSLPAIKELFAGFKTFDDRHPLTVRSHTIVTPVLPSGLQWLVRDPGRVKRARPFYRPFSSLMQDHDAKLHADYAAAFGADGPWIAESVDIEPTPIPDPTAAEAMFGRELHAAFPSLDIGGRTNEKAFKALLDRVRLNRGQMIDRAEIVSILGAAGVSLPVSPALRFRMRAENDLPDTGSIEIDVSPFSGVGGYPDGATWTQGLLEPLARVASFARDQGLPRIQLSGRFRLTTAILLRWSFRSAIGFDLDIPTRKGAWRTDAHPASATTSLPWEVDTTATLHQGRLAVAVGVLRDPSGGLAATLPDSNPLRLILEQAISSETEAQESVREIKRAIDATVATLKPQAIDLFFVGPAALAVALGHRWNGMPPTQLFEFVAESGSYVLTGKLG